MEAGHNNEDHIKTNLEEEKPHHRRVRTSPSSSSSSSSSSAFRSHDFEKDSPLPSENLIKLPESYPSPETINNAQTPNWSMMSASPPPGYAYFSPDDNHLQNYDPNRIPMSVFSSKPANASEWSVASNESLFSIQMGNDYSQDYSSMYKLGELPRLDEKGSCNDRFSGCLPTVVEAHEEGSVRSQHNNYKLDDDDEDKRFSVSNSSKVDDDDDDTCRVSNRPKNNCEKEKINNSRVSDSRLSDDSGNSNGSFAFPVLVNDGGGKNKSLKAVPEKQQLQEQVVTTSPDSPNNKASSSSAMTRWCSWFCWCPTRSCC